MMIQKITLSNQKFDEKKQENQVPCFKGVSQGLLNGLGWMKNNPSMAACGVDFASMVVPRTAVETKDRGIQSGIETFIREISSLIVHATIGLIGFGVSSAISGKFNEKYGVKSQNIFASGDTISNMSEIWRSNGNNQQSFFEGFTKNLKGLDGENWRNIPEVSRKETVNSLVKLADKTLEFENVQGEKKSLLKEEIKNLKSVLTSKIIKETGAKSSFKLMGQNNAKEISASIDELVDSAVSLSNAFKKQSEKQFGEFVKNLIKNKKLTAIIGLGITSAITVSVQPINRIMTKKRTGDDGFVGVDSKENDNSTSFKALKTALGLGFPLFAISTTDAKPKDLLSSVQYNGKIPTINQFKFIYGLTISSRLLASRDGNELRESMIKDTLGFCTWLLFGDFVSKLATKAMSGKELINNPISKEKSSKNPLIYAKDWLMQTSVKSFDEILMPVSNKICENGKKLSFKELYNNAPEKVKSQVKKAAAAQMIGYIFSGVVLGYGIAKLNIFITKHLHSEEKARKQMNKEISKTNNAYKLNGVFLNKISNKDKNPFKEFYTLP